MNALSRQISGLLFIVGIVAFIVWYVNSGRRAAVVPQGTAVAPESIAGVDAEGSGGDPALNEEKNRYTAPDHVEDLSVSQIIAIPSDQLDHAGRMRRASWSGSAKSYVEKQEARGVRVTGYLVRAKESGPESCNGYIDSLRDYHIWISDDPTNVKANAMIVEITPRWKLVHPEWRLRYIERLASQHAKVRVTGWLMWDEEHADEVDKSRATQWEVHPVTNFEVESGTTWRPLAAQVN